MEFERIKDKKLKKFCLGLEQSLINPQDQPKEIDYTDLLEKAKSSIYNQLQTKEIISMVRGSRPHARYRDHPLLKKAGYFWDWGGLDSLSRNELIAVCILTQR